MHSLLLGEEHQRVSLLHLLPVLFRDHCEEAVFHSLKLAIAYEFSQPAVTKQSIKCLLSINGCSKDVSFLNGILNRIQGHPELSPVLLIFPPITSHDCIAPLSVLGIGSLQESVHGIPVLRQVGPETTTLVAVKREQLLP